MHFKKTSIILVISICLLAAGPLFAQVPELKPTGFVNDNAHIINDQTKAKLTTLLSSFEQKTRIEFTVVTVATIGDTPIEDFATRLFEEWGIGKKGEDNGLLLLIAPKERKLRLEVGYGLEGAINDALAGRIIRETIVPWFTKGDYSTGILNGVVASIEILNSKYNLGFDPFKTGDIQPKQLIEVKKSSVIGKILKIIVLIFLILLFIKNPWAFLLFMGLSGGRSGGFRGGSFGGGSSFGGFGGGLSGGGGASGSW